MAASTWATVSKRWWRSRASTQRVKSALVRSGKADATMVLYPGGTHSLAGSGRPSHRQDYHERIVDFLEQTQYSDKPT